MAYSIQSKRDSLRVLGVSPLASSRGSYWPEASPREKNCRSRSMMRAEQSFSGNEYIYVGRAMLPSYLLESEEQSG